MVFVLLFGILLHFMVGFLEGCWFQFSWWLVSTLSFTETAFETCLVNVGSFWCFPDDFVCTFGLILQCYRAFLRDLPLGSCKTNWHVASHCGFFSFDPKSFGNMLNQIGDPVRS